MRKTILLAAAAFAATIGATPALADKPSVTPATNPCSIAYVPGSIACVGYFTGNFFQGGAGSATTPEASAAIAQLLGGPAATDSNSSYTPPYSLDYDTILAAIPNQTDGDASFDYGSIDLTGLTIFGAHFGNNTDGGDASNISAVWLIDLGSTTTHTITLLNGQGVSNAQIFATGQTPGVPEPSTWAMMLMGFGATGFAVRRSRRKALLTQIA
jgi:hypothetical protein